MVAIAPRGHPWLAEATSCAGQGGGGFRQSNRLELAAYSPRLMERYPSSLFLLEVGTGGQWPDWQKLADSLDTIGVTLVD
jgi:hypothetical protein